MRVVKDHDNVAPCAKLGDHVVLERLSRRDEEPRSSGVLHSRKLKREAALSKPAIPVDQKEAHARLERVVERLDVGPPTDKRRHKNGSAAGENLGELVCCQEEGVARTGKAE